MLFVRKLSLKIRITESDALLIDALFFLCSYPEALKVTLETDKAILNSSTVHLEEKSGACQFYISFCC